MSPLKKVMSEKEYAVEKTKFMIEARDKLKDEDLCQRISRTLMAKRQDGNIDTDMGATRMKWYRKALEEGDIESWLKRYENADRERRREAEHPRVEPQKNPEEIRAENEQRWENHLAHEDR